MSFVLASQTVFRTNNEKSALAMPKKDTRRREEKGFKKERQSQMLNMFL